MDGLKKSMQAKGQTKVPRKSVAARAKYPASEKSARASKALSDAFCDFRGDALQSADYRTQWYNIGLGSSGLNTPIKATLVPDIECFRHMPGAYELSASDHDMLLACPCGCGHVECISLICAKLADRAAPTLNAPVIITCLKQGMNVLHWAGNMINGQLVPLIDLS
jgi:hypothetical protein